MKLLNKWGHVFDNVVGGGMWIACSMLTFTMFLVTAEVLIRYFFRMSIGWDFEVCEYSLLAICFTGAAWMLKEGRHVRILFLLDQLKPKAQAMVNIITCGLATITYLVLTLFGVLVAWDNFQLDITIHKMLHTPKFILIAIIAAGCLLLFIQLLRMTYGHIERWRLLRRE